jgi:hypothetical protein
VLKTPNQNSLSTMLSTSLSPEPTSENITTLGDSSSLARPDDYDFHFSESDETPLIAKGSLQGKSGSDKVKSNSLFYFFLITNICEQASTSVPSSSTRPVWAAATNHRVAACLGHKQAAPVRKIAGCRSSVPSHSLKPQNRPLDSFIS